MQAGRWNFLFRLTAEDVRLTAEDVRVKMNLIFNQHSDKN